MSLRNHRLSSQPMGDSVDISVVIPVRNGGPFVSHQIEALLAQESNATFEVVVADNGSTDETAQIARSLAERDPRVRVVDASRGIGVNVARNVGAQAARGRVILLTDADDVVHPGWVDAYWRAFQSGAHTAGGSLHRILQDGTVLARESKLYSSLMTGSAFANGTNCGFTRAAFDAVGGFDETLMGGADEIDFFARTSRNGYRMTLVPDAVVDKLQHTDLSDAFHQHFNFGRGEILLATRFKPSMVSLPMAAVAAMHALLWFSAWATVGRLRRWRRPTAMRMAFALGMLVEEAKILSR
ncbi:glycosyl transferase [Mycolicibacterium monacense]|nr:glycosyl transferase [Mycolicibacterium monacense]OBF52614.1 glycosyl transferase [Mycolicibacterium monacense]ORB20051.1 glycosyl transferase [Mycolicibacterium monacense DSM 44395]QHP89319.1 glycosyltransferase [Mycolicibacterium monacense DSM 44395]